MLSFRRKWFAVRVCVVVVDSVRRHDAQHEGQKKNLPDSKLAPLSPKRGTPLETVARILAGIGVWDAWKCKVKSSSPCSGRKSSARVQASDTDSHCGVIMINNTLCSN